MFKEYGSSSVVRYMLKHVYPADAVFREIKAFDELIVGREVSYCTFSNALSKLIPKGVIRRESGYRSSM